MRLIWCYEKPCQILRHETSFRLYLLQVLFIWAVENSQKSGISRCVISHNSIILKHVLQLLSLGLIFFHKCLLWFLEIKSINSVSNDFFQDVYIAQVSISSRNHCLNASGLSWICWAHCHSQESLTEWTGILKTTLNFAGFFFANLFPFLVKGEVCIFLLPMFLETVCHQVLCICTWRLEDNFRCCCSGRCHFKRKDLSPIRLG